MNKNGKLSLVVKHDCHCTYTNENCDNGNQKATSEHGVSFEQKSPAIIFFCNLYFLASHCYRSVKPIYKNNKHIFRLH